MSIRGLASITDETNGAVVDTTALVEPETVQKILDVLEGDMIPTASEWQILHKATKAILVNKNAQVVNGLTQLIEPV
jgi:hypothetical protein